MGLPRQRNYKMIEGLNRHWLYDTAQIAFEIPFFNTAADFDICFQDRRDLAVYGVLIEVEVEGTHTHTEECKNNNYFTAAHSDKRLSRKAASNKLMTNYQMAHKNGRHPA